MSQPTEPRPTPRTTLSRRHALGGVAGVGLGLPLLAACGGDTTATGPTTTQTPAVADPTGSTGGEATPEPAAAFAATGDVPVGGGALFPDEGVVVTQPAEGEFLGFSITCTHQGCPVDSITENGISCPCHGSIFDLSTGEPLSGPASAPLSAVQLAIQGDQISRA